MSLRWQKLLGDTNRFAFKLSFEADPDGGQCATREESVSWGSFELWVRGQNLCTHIEEGETVAATHWYLLPLLEWLVENWDPLFHEGKLPVRNPRSGEGNVIADAWSSLEETSCPPLGYSEEKAEEWSAQWSSWWSRHSLQSCREDGLFPDVVIRRFCDQIEIAWGPSALPGTPADFRFLAAQGHVRLDVRDVARPVHEVIREAVEFLLDELPHSHRLQALKNATAALQEHTHHDRRLAWLSGLGRSPQQMLDAWRKCVAQFQDQPQFSAVFRAEEEPLVIRGSCSAALMFGSVSPSLHFGDVMALAQKLVDLTSKRRASASLTRLIRDEPVQIGEKKIWDQGYRLAEEVLKELSLDTERTTHVDIDRVLRKLGIRTDRMMLKDTGIRAIAVAGPEHRPAVVVNDRHPSNKHIHGYRFTLAHELCHHLFDRAHGKVLSLASGPWAPEDIERRANAFAAMFLMPPPVIRNVIAILPESLESVEGIRRLGQRLKTSFNATVEHLGNLGFLDATVREQIRSEWENRAAEGLEPNPTER